MSYSDPTDSYSYLRVTNPDPQNDDIATQQHDGASEIASVCCSQESILDESENIARHELRPEEVAPAVQKSKRQRLQRWFQGRNRPKDRPAVTYTLSSRRLWDWRNRWSQLKQIYGWRLGVLAGFCTVVFVLFINLIILVVGAAKSGGYKSGIAFLANGTVSYITKWSTVSHIAINTLSTLLLCASNYTMQVLNSPSREDVDRAHSQGLHLDIGILSLRNLRFISRKRAILWWILGISSVPLHIFYNSTIFDVVAGNQFNVNTVEYLSPKFTALNSSASTNASTPYINLTNQQWRQIYGDRYVSGNGDLFLVVDAISMDLPSYHDVLNNSFAPNVSNPMSSDFLDLNYNNQNQVHYGNSTFSLPQMSSEGWVSQDAFNSSLSQPTRIRYAFARNVPTGNSRLELSLFFMLIVIFSNIVKATTMLLVLMESESNYLVTTGDAVASFLTKPDPLTIGLCTLSKHDMLIQFGREPTRRDQQDAERMAKLQSRLDGVWKARNRRLGAAISDGRQAFGMAVCALMILTGIVVFVTSVSGENGGIDSWGTSSPSTLAIGSSNFDTKGTLYNAALANLPQLFFSIGYLTFNGFFTCVANAAEWDNLALYRKSLRVTKPQGKQRSTHFLQLPFKYAIPLTITSGTIHWLMSQSLFLVRIDIQDRNGTLRPELGSKSACGFSNLSFLCVWVIFTLLSLVAIAVSLRRWRTNIPFAAACSFVVSAACHPKSEDEDLHLEPLQWGVDEGSSVGPAHCSLSNHPVTKPLNGKKYV